MMITQRTWSFSFISVMLMLLVLAGCGTSLKVKYRPKKLYDLNAFSADDFKKKEHVTIFVKKFDKNDCSYYFNSSISSLVPIQVTIINDKEHPIVFNPEQINMPLASYKTIKKYIRPSYWRSCGIFALGPVVGGAIAAAVSHVVPFAIIGGLLSIAILGTSIYKGATSATKHARHLAHARELAIANVQEKVIQHAITVYPGNTFSCILFIKRKDFNPRMIIDLFRADDTSSKQRFSFHLTDKLSIW